MLRTPLCDLYGIETPIILAAMGSCTSAQFAAAVCNAGGLGALGTLNRKFNKVKNDIDSLKLLTDRPFHVNHIPQTLDEEAFQYTLAMRPAVISFSLADPGDLAKRAHDVGALVQVQISTVKQAIEAVKSGADVIVAQGSEGGGYCGEVATMALLPQVVDAVAPIPVVAAGGIFDGRGMAAAFMLGAVGVNIGTRLLVSVESPAVIEWKQALIAAEAEDARRFEILNEIRPLPGTVGYKNVVRSLPTPFLEEWSAKPEEARRERDRLSKAITEANATGKSYECLLTGGQSAGAISNIPSVAEIMQQMIDQAQSVLASVPASVIQA